MGNIGSSQTTYPADSHEDVFEKTKSTRELLGTLTDFMLKQITVRDFLALSNPTECKKYVLFMANQLHRYFYEVKITPEKDVRSGIIAFRPAKDLLAPQTPEKDREKQSICLTLAYYYTRIFQIYSALALTLIDDIEVVKKSGVGQMMVQQGDQLYAPGYQFYTPSSAASSAAAATAAAADPTTTETSWWGGAGGMTLEGFDFLIPYLSRTIPDSRGAYLTMYNQKDATIEFTKEGDLFNAKGNPLPASAYTDTKYYKGRFSIGLKGHHQYSYVDVMSKSTTGSDEMTMIIRMLHYYPKGSSEQKMVQLTNDMMPTGSHTVSFIMDRSATTPVVRVKDSATFPSVNDYLKALFDRVVRFLRESVLHLSTLGTGTGTIADVLDPLTKSEENTPMELRIGRTVSNLLTTKPMGHCIARALQLLRTQPFADKDNLSSICKARFMEERSTDPSKPRTYSRSGLPVTDLSESPGLYALSQLFYDTIATGSPRLEINRDRGADGSPSSMDQYVHFMKVMAVSFGDYERSPGQPRSDEEFSRAGLKDIKTRRDAELCRDGTQRPMVDQEIRLPFDVASDVYEIVKEMYRVQLKHAAKCGEIFHALFRIERYPDMAPRVMLHERIIAGGLPEVERINRYARGVLMEYYSTCEGYYTKGMAKVLTHHRRKTAVPSVPSVPSASSATQRQVRFAPGPPSIRGGRRKTVAVKRYHVHKI